MKTASAKARIGRQTPTTAFVLPYENTCGAEAVELYNSTGRAAQQWQELLLYDMLAENADGLWTHTKFGYSVPRRNGKNEVVAMRELYGMVKRGEHILHTAHRTTTTHSAWERLLNLLAKASIPVASSYRAFGKEHIELDNGGKVEFRTRTSKGGLGEGFDLLVIDEAQEYQDDQESALKYVVTDSKNPQTLFCGTPPTPTSSGKVFVNFRTAVLQGRTQNSAWEEWGVERETDPNDRNAWYETNPSLGTVFTERSIADEIGSDTVDFNIQRLGLWISYNQKSAISKSEWDALKLSALPPLAGKLFVGVKYAHDGDSVALSIAARTGKKVFVEALDCRSVRSGNAWIMKFLASTAHAVETVTVDGANGQELLAAKMKREGLRAPVEPSVKQIITANAAFEQAIFAGTLCHMGQPSLTQAAANCEKRAIGSAGGFGYRSIRDGVDITLLDSVILAHWAATEGRRKRKKQKISY